MSQSSQEPQAQSVDPAIAYRIAMMRLGQVTEELVLSQASVHEARTALANLQKELNDTYEATNAEINKLAGENQQLRIQLEEFMTDGGSDNDEVSIQPQSINGQNQTAP